MNKVIIPKENVSDNEYKIVSIAKNYNDFVKSGELIGEIESSKAIIELFAEHAGYFYSDLKAGDIIGVGEVFGVLNDIEFIERPLIRVLAEPSENLTVGNAIITKKAQELILKYNVPIDELVNLMGDKEIISERDILKHLDGNFVELEGVELAAKYSSFTSKKLKRIAIIGAGASAIQTIDLMLSIGEYVPACIFDDTPYKIQKKLLGVPILDRIDFESIAKYYEDSYFDQVIVAIPSSIPFRAKVYEGLKDRRLPFANLIHESVYLGLNVEIGDGNIILPHCHIGSCTRIGNNNFITSMSSIEHNNEVGDHCTFGPGVMLSGTVTVGNRVKFGTGIFVEPYVKIGDNAVISSGCILTKNVEESTTVINNRNLVYRK